MNIQEKSNSINYKKTIWKDRLKLIEIEFLCKLNYWIVKCGKQIKDNNNLWIYNTQQEWAKQIYCSISTIKRTIKNLEERRIISSKKIESKRGNQTKWYTINYKKFKYKYNLESNLTYRNKWKIPLFQKELISYYNDNNNTNNYRVDKTNKFEREKEKKECIEKPK